MPGSYRYRVVDVFTQVPLEGNALAVFPDARGIDDAIMQRIARELNLSETVFIQPAMRADCAAWFRIFTPTREMIFAGHPTVGGSYVLLAEGMVPLGVEHFSVEEKVGPVPIRVEPGERQMIWLTTPAIAFREEYDPKLCARALGLNAEALLPIRPQLVDAGNPTLFVALKSKADVDRCSIDATAFSALRYDRDKAFCIFAFSPTDQGAYSRMFAPEYGIVEDPATGSSTGPLAAFMHRHDLLPKAGGKRLVSEQGTKMGRRSLLYFDISAIDTQDGIPVGGYVTPLVEAVMTLE